MSRLDFRIEGKAAGTQARAGRMTTLHGEVLTPVFMPVGTQATVKSQTVTSLKTIGASVLLANTYHLLLRPGLEVFKRFGGIHRFMNWDRPVLTDSGGFQIFSLPRSRKLDEAGATFKSYVDHKDVFLSPEVSIEMQRAIGSDIMMVLDECVPSTSDYTTAERAMHLTHRWAKRSLQARKDSAQALFGIVQGACFSDLRKQSAEVLQNIFVNGEGFDGLAIGGLAVGESKSEREDFTELSASYLPEHLPRYLMGVGTPLDILEAVHRGVDMFDCILPSQHAQRGVAYTSQGKVQLRRQAYQFSEEKLDPDCHCETCTFYSKAYLQHLHKTKEVLGWHLIALHNFTFYQKLMTEMRDAILQGTFLNYYQTTRLRLSFSDTESEEGEKQKPRRKNHLGNFEVVSSEKGFSSIRQISSGEVMHSVNDPDSEAQALYIEPSRFDLRCKKGAEIIVWDLGLGAGHNAMAALKAILQEKEKASDQAFEAKIFSFEEDLDAFRLAAKNANLFPHLRSRIPTDLLDKHEWSDQTGVTLKLVKGDFLETFANCPSPDLIYFDFFSHGFNPKLWDLSLLKAIRARANEAGALLMTYSASTAVRASLLAAGWWVGYGAASGPKKNTTIALSQEPQACDQSMLPEIKWLGPEFLARFGRSQAKQKEIESAVYNHPQFFNRGALA